MTEPSVPLAGSERAAMPGATPAAPSQALDPAERIDATVIVRRRAAVPAELTEGPRTIEPAELADTYGADDADVELVRSVLTAHGLAIEGVDARSRRVQISGTVADMSATFGVALGRATSPDPATGRPVSHRHRTGALSVPGELDGVVVAVLGLDDRPQARAHFRVARDPDAAKATSYTPLQLGTAYDFPTDADGMGQTLAIIELGGGFDQKDLDTYFGDLGIATPTVKAASVDKAKNVPGGDPQGADGEVLLDIEVAGALVPKSTMLVYFAPNTDRGFVDAVSDAVHASPTPTALSISWGGSEDSWTAASRTALDEAFVDAAALGITVCVAAGDNGSSDGVSGSTPHVDFPASSPHVLACGGTSLQGAGNAHETETVWNDGADGGATGGGVSDAFALPSWQANVGVPARAAGGTGRGVPDVAADADPQTGYQVIVDGRATVVGGTSAVAPLWAALTCRLAQRAGRRLGLLQPTLYAGAGAGTTPAGFRDVTSGNNGAYAAGPGWDACTGLGVPDGTALLAVFTAAT